MIFLITRYIVYLLLIILIQQSIGCHYQVQYMKVNNKPGHMSLKDEFQIQYNLLKLVNFIAIKRVKMESSIVHQEHPFIQNQKYNSFNLKTHSILTLIPQQFFYAFLNLFLHIDAIQSFQYLISILLNISHYINFPFLHGLILILLHFNRSLILVIGYQFHHTLSYCLINLYQNYHPLLLYQTI